MYVCVCVRACVRSCVYIHKIYTYTRGLPAVPAPAVLAEGSSSTINTISIASTTATATTNTDKHNVAMYLILQQWCSHDMFSFSLLKFRLQQ